MTHSGKRFSLQNISNARTLLMGLATLWVTISHCTEMDFTKSSLLMSLHIAPALNFIRDLGNAGVDIFLLVSGYGLYYSLSKNKNVKQFYARRFTRILPAILIVSILYYGIIGASSFGEYLAQVFQVALFHPTYDRGEFWYFSLLIVLYLLYPLLHRVVEKFDWKGALGLIVLSVGFSLLVRVISLDYFDKTNIALLRVPIFIIGIWLGKKSKEGMEIPSGLAASAIVLTILYVILLVYLPLPDGWSCLQRYLFIPLTIGIVFAVSWLNSRIPNNGLRRLIELVGLYSMEIYLTFRPLYLHLTGFFKVSDSMGVTYSLACFVASLLLAFALKKVSGIIAGAIQRSDKTGLA